jgi:ethanolamine utilization protein EutA
VTTSDIEARERDHPLWHSDHIVLTTVGVDIGSATVQVVFCRLRLRRMARALSARYAVVERDTWYRSPVAFTPFHAGELDAAALAEFTTASYVAAGIAPASVDTGVVILTGEAADRRNARIVADVLAGIGGRFVSVAAGHRLEAVLAAHGSGAVALSRTAASRILNIDIGGGTTKLALVVSGVVVATAALHAGARLVAFDRADRVERLDPAGARLAAACGYSWAPGVRVEPEQVRTVAGHLASAIIEAARGGSGSHGLWLTEPLAVPEVDAVIFSGGVAEYIGGHETVSHRDLGQPLGAELDRRQGELPAVVVPAAARLRATVVGAGQHSVQVSGNTIYTRPRSALPLRDLPVVRPHLALGDVVDPDAVALAIREHMRPLGEVADGPVAIALDWSGDPSYARLRGLALGIRAARGDAVAAGWPLCLVFDHDVAQLVGMQLEDLMPGGTRTGPVVIVDGVTLADLDFIDIGPVMPHSGTVAITIKSLLFGL